MTNLDLQALAKQLGLDAAPLAALNITREGRFWLNPERNSDGEITGFATRDDAGHKGFKGGGKRGLTLAWPIDSYAGSSPENPVLIVEGMTDTAAGMAHGFTTIGRPSATGGLDFLRPLTAGLHIVIVAENDSGAGKAGALKIADGLLDTAASVRIIYPPDGVKDLRAWVVDHGCDRAELHAAIRGADLHQRTTVVDKNGLTRRANVIRLADVQPEGVRWLWPERIAVGKLTLLAGDPGLGKSFVTLDMAARVSTGAGWPDDHGQPCEPGGVVLLNAEDDAADTIRPRLDAAGADVSRVVALESVITLDQRTGTEQDATFSLATDLPALEEAIAQVERCRLVVIDPISAYTGRADSHNNAEVRGLLAPLAKLAAERGVAVVAVTHLNKNANGPAIYRSMGSLAFAAAARAVWMVTKDKDDPSRRLMLPAKNNIAPDVNGLAYRIEGEAMAAKVLWDDEPVNCSADEALAPVGDPRDRTDREQAADWLREALQDGPVPSVELFAQAKENGIAGRTLRRAYKDLGGKPMKVDFSGGWCWKLPDEVGQMNHEDSQDGHPLSVGNFGNGGHLRLHDAGGEYGES